MYTILNAMRQINEGPTTTHQQHLSRLTHRCKDLIRHLLLRLPIQALHVHVPYQLPRQLHRLPHVAQEGAQQLELERLAWEPRSCHVIICLQGEGVGHAKRLVLQLLEQFWRKSECGGA